MKLFALIALLSINVIAGNIVVGGYIPPKSDCKVELLHPDLTQPGEMVELAEIDITNNLPNYHLYVTVVGLNLRELAITGKGGHLGRGIEPPQGTMMAHDGSTGYTWRPTVQSSATLNYRVVLLGTFDEAPSGQVYINSVCPGSM